MKKQKQDDEEKLGFKQLPKGFKNYKGRCTWDAPQEVWAMNDFDEVELFLRSGEIVVKQVFEINWKATFLKTDIVGWKKLTVKETIHESSSETCS